MHKKKDYSDEFLDFKEKEIYKELHSLYEECQKEIDEELEDFFKKFDKKNEKWLKKLKNGEITEQEYKRWLEGQIFQGKMWAERKETIANQLYDFNETAYKIINEAYPDIFINEFNYMAYLLEHKEGIDLSFYIYDPETIRQLIIEDIDILPYKKLNKAKDIQWNFKNIKREVAKAIIKGDAVKDLAKKLSKEVTNRNEKQMQMHARTALNSARNQARLKRIEDGEKMGLKIYKEWSATLDFRTRIAHANLDGIRIPPNESFEIDGMKIRFPSDPYAHPSLVCNCRCTLEGDLKGYPDTFDLRRDNEAGEIIQKMSYKEWYKWKTGEELPKYKKPKKKKKKKE
jgi:SPP1 gp7 family putative phage head morphogenesis protein